MNIQHNEKEKIFFVDIEGKVAKLSYKNTDEKTLDYYSTFVPPEFRGKNVGEQLVKVALDYARDNNFKIIPTCPFVARIIDRHPEYEGLVKE